MRPTATRAAPGASETQRRVPSDAAGSRLDRFLASLPEVGSRAAAETLVAAGTVLVDGERRPKSHRLQGGEEVEFEPLVDEVAAGDVPDLRIAYEDDDLLVVDKPAGVAVHPGAGRAGGTLAQALAGVAGGGPAERAGIVHRLDRDTSGLLCVARHEESFRRLQRLVRRRELERAYLALVRGRPRSRRGTIEAAIGRDRSDPLRRSLDSDAPREAITYFEVEDLLREHTLLGVRLETGRTHQIRVHLAAIDLPVVGDPVYGVPGLGLERQFLHATQIAFTHPFTGERIEVGSPLPPDLEAALVRAREL